jgi:uncharacterized protein YgbK (DUF1537 family)
MSRLGIMADDLTGAAEAAVACRRLGHRAVVATCPDALSPPSGGPAVLVVDTNTRHRPPEGAARAVRDCAARLTAAGCDLLCKKTDSTLRGNIAAELCALLDRRPRAALVYAPAFPAAGRTVRDGVLRVHGTPVAQTEFHDDPLSPVTDSSVPHMLREWGSHPVRSVGLDALRAGADLGSPGHIVVVDGEREQDLAMAARASRGPEFLHAGPSAFADHVARVSGLPRGQAPGDAPGGPWLVLSGSLNSVSLAQVRAAESAGACMLRLTPDQVFGPAPGQAAVEEMAARAARAWDEHRLVVLHTARHPADREAYRAAAAEHGLQPGPAAQQLTARLAATCARLLRRLGQGGVLAFGGETCRTLVDRLGVRRMEALREVVRGSGVLRAQNGLLLGTKSGGFGNEDFLEEFKTCCWE